MRVSDGMGSHLEITRQGPRVSISANVHLVPLVIDYALLIATIGFFYWRKKRRKNAV